MLLKVPLKMCTPQNPLSISATPDNGFSWGENFQCCPQNFFVIVRIGPVSTLASLKG